MANCSLLQAWATPYALGNSLSPAEALALILYTLTIEAKLLVRRGVWRNQGGCGKGNDGMITLTHHNRTLKIEFENE